ncbi:MAG TPA: hypothetical protein VF808_08920 [Ktedonobacterales bacterium]
MADNDERNNGAERVAPQEPVDLSSRRQERQRADAEPGRSNGDWMDPRDRDEQADELEAQAREIVRAFRENAGELGERVQQAIAHARVLWEESAVIDAPIPDDLHPDEPRARALMRRWVKRDFLVDPDLPSSMSIISLHDTEVWRVDLRERGETRELVHATEPYNGTRPGPAMPIQPVWDYTFATTPEIESGERRVRLEGAAALGVCERCHGSGKRACAHCASKGFVTCPECRGRGRKTCPRCRGRGRIADAAAERRARAAKSYFQVHAERLAQNAVERLADLSERLRQDYGAPLPPSANWAPTAPASGETIPCPDCHGGTVACSCNEGKLACPVCHGTENEPCSSCQGTGKVIRHQEIARRFDTRIRTRLAIPAHEAASEWITDDMLQRVNGDVVWEGPADDLDGPAPAGAPLLVWEAALALKRHADAELESEAPTGGLERRVLWRRVRLARAPISRLEYAYAGRMYTVVAVGRAGEERFWADNFPPRWHRVSRFFQAVVRDINGETVQRRHTHYSERHATPSRIPPHSAVHALDEAKPDATSARADGPQSEPDQVE